MASFEGINTATYSEWLQVFKEGTLPWASGAEELSMRMAVHEKGYPNCCALCKRGGIHSAVVSLSRCGRCRSVLYCRQVFQRCPAALLAIDTGR